MKPNAGLWIDHREAFVVMLSETGAGTQRIQSSVEKHLRRASEPATGPFAAQEVPADDSRQRQYTGNLAHYYDEIIAHLRDAGAIFIMGPGEAKGELKKQFEKHKSETRSIVLETADKMTDHQVVAQVRHHFHADPKRQGI